MKDKALCALIVEDSKDDALLIIRGLKKGGYNPVYELVETAASMKKALQEKQWDIILCDYSLPKFNAPSAIAVLKEVNVNIPIIIISGTIGEETAIECMRLGAQDYIMKSNLSRLCPAIARELKESKVRNKQKHTEEKLRHEEQRFQALVENSSDIIVLINLEGIITYINPAVERVLGFNPEERIGAKALELVHPDDMKFLTDSFNTLARDTNSPVIQGEMHLRHKDGSWRTLEAVGSNQVHNNVVEYVIVNYRDITEHKRAEELLKKSEAQYRLLADHMKDQVWLMDLDLNWTYISPSVEKLLEYKLEELKQLPLNKLLTATSYQTAMNVFSMEMEKALSAPSFKHLMELACRCKNGRIIWVEIMFSFIRDEKGKPLSLLGEGRDITERKKTEELLKQSEAQYRLLADHMKDQVWLMDLDLKWTYISPSVEKLSGYKIEELLQLPLDKLITPESYQKAMDFFSIQMFKARKDSPPSTLKQLVELEFRRKDGRTLWIESSFSFIRDEKGKPLSILGEARDITERKQAEVKLQHTLERIKKAVGTTIQVLVSASESRDPYTAGHQSRTANLACVIATEMGLDQDKVEGIRMAGIIHDIGKLSIPAEILSKPTKLTEIEFSLIKEHSLSGYEMLKDVESPWPLAEIVYQHHERMNGFGYPRNLKGNEIIMESRILAVADVVEAMASHRPYRSSLGIDAALREIKKNKGILYDEAVVDACLRLFREKGYQLT
jgi:PAS domain S-box-containing protein/putative nucleotidyltransferase with HDIG domain